MNLIAAIISIALLAAFDIASIAVGAVFKNACGICSYGGIAFDMAIFLLAGGSVGVILIGLAVLCILSEHEVSGKLLLYLNALFAFAWGIVGAVLLGSTSSTPCASRCYSVYVMCIVYVVILLIRGAASLFGANNKRE